MWIGTALDTLYTLFNVFSQELLSYCYPHFVDIVQGQMFSMQTQVFLIPESMDFSPHCVILSLITMHRVLTVICSLNDLGERLI